MKELLNNSKKTLQDALIEKTRDLKDLFIDESAKYAENEYNSLMQKKSWTYQQWVDNYLVKSSAGPTLSRKGHHERDRVYLAYKMGPEAWIKKATDAAYAHYNNSISKLTDRLTKKGIGSNFNIKASRLGVNFEMIIEDDHTIVRAWTIVASGHIQRPHYRYLVR
jgi:hypothetical protein